jgi:hypothetical protein
MSLQPQTPKDVCLPVGITDTHALLGHVTRLDASRRAEWTDNLIGQSFMLARDEKAPATVNIAEQLPCTKVAISNPEVIGLHGLENRRKQRALLGMAIFTRKDVAHDAVGRFIHHQ